MHHASIHENCRPAMMTTQQHRMHTRMSTMPDSPNDRTQQHGGASCVLVLIIARHAQQRPCHCKSCACTQQNSAAVQLEVSSSSGRDTLGKQAADILASHVLCAQVAVHSSVTLCTCTLCASECVHGRVFHPSTSCVSVLPPTCFSAGSCTTRSERRNTPW